MPPYISVWATVAGAFLVSKTSNNLQVHNENISKKYSYIQLGLIFLILTPLPFTFGDPACNTTFNIFFGSFNFLLFFILVIAVWFQHKKSKQRS
jgi:cytochrome bd-type quinol oxidase subunit 2